MVFMVLFPTDYCSIAYLVILAKLQSLSNWEFGLSNILNHLAVNLNLGMAMISHNSNPFSKLMDSPIVRVC